MYRTGNHHTANPDYRYDCQGRFHRYDAPNNPVEKTGKSNRITVTSDTPENQRWEKRIIAQFKQHQKRLKTKSKPIRELVYTYGDL